VESKEGRFCWLALTAMLAGCAAIFNPSAPQPAPAAGYSNRAASKIHHIVIIFQENRTPDDLFNGFPGADTVRSGRNAQGKEVKLQPIGLTAPYDLGHSHSAFETEYDDGKLDGFAKVPSKCYNINVCLPADVRAYGYVPRQDVQPYFAMATRYTFGDRMFQTNEGPSFPAHQYIVSGTSTIANGSSLRAADNPFDPTGGANGGCDSPAGSLVSVINAAGVEKQGVYPCFDRISLMQLLDTKSLSWRYYQAATGAGIWNGPDAVLPIFRSREFSTDVVAPSSQILKDVANGSLADVAWVTPTALSSDHALATNGSGPSWWGVYGSDLLARTVRDDYAAFGVPTQVNEGGSPGELARIQFQAPSFYLHNKGVYYHADADSPAIVPEDSLRNAVQAFCKIFNDINKVDMKDLKPPASSMPRTQQGH